MSEPRTSPTNVCVLLAGALKSSPLTAASGMSVLDLWLTRERTVLGLWIDALRETGRPWEVRVAHNRQTPSPRELGEHDGVMVREVVDSGSYRGPAGVARDATEDVSDDAEVLVCEAGRWISSGLTELLHAHEVGGADVTVGVNPDQSPAGVFALRRTALKLAPAVGFMDMKEQWLDRVRATGGNVRGLTLSGRGALPLRSRLGFVRAGMTAAGWTGSDDLDEVRTIEGGGANAGAVFRVIGAGAGIGAGAHVEDSIVMGDAMVGAGALVVRSVVCPGARVEAGAEVVDAIVGTRGVVRDMEGRQERMERNRA
ncbi:MAG: hypothetical protein AB7G17_10660 [Phycisphaerales bacterium]